MLKFAPAWLALLLVATSAAGDLTTPRGLWQPLDSSGKPMGLIRIYEDHGGYFGRVEPSSPNDDRSRRCAKCADERRDQPVIGITLIRNMRGRGDDYSGGDILDPDTGRIYGCKFKLIDGGRRMIMRGFFGVSLLGESQTWQRVTTEP